MIHTVPFYKTISDGYITGIGTNGPDTVISISKEEYQELLSIIHAKPADPDGYMYMLRADTLQWDLVEVADEDVGEEDYIQVLDDLGVRLG